MRKDSIAAKSISVCLLLILSSSIAFAQTGNVKTYFPNGNIQTETSYINDIIDGSMVTYYQNGNLQSEKNFSGGVMNGAVREYYPSGLLKEEYSVDQGIKEGIDRSYYDNGGLKSVIKYSQGKAVDQTFFDFDPHYKASPQDYLSGKKANSENESNATSTCDAEVCAEPIGGQKAIQDNLVYPEHALRYGLEGTVTLKASINSNGEVTKTDIIKGLGLGCDEAAEDAVKKTKFIPGKNGGKPVDSVLLLNVDFKINPN